MSFLAVATAVWVAYHGGFQRLADALGNPSHPLFATVSETSLGADLELQRGVVATLLATVVGTGGLVLVHWATEAVTAPSGPVVVEFGDSAGIPLDAVPFEVLSEASFLLAVLLVVGSAAVVRGLLKGVAVLFGVQSTVQIAPVLLPPRPPVDLWAPQGPILAPLGDALVLVGVAVAVWLAFDGGLERLRGRVPFPLPPERDVRGS